MKKLLSFLLLIIPISLFGQTETRINPWGIGGNNGTNVAKVAAIVHDSIERWDVDSIKVIGLKIHLYKNGADYTNDTLLGVTNLNTYCFGSANTRSNLYNYTFGNNNVVTSDYSIAMGSNNTVSDDLTRSGSSSRSTAFGYYNILKDWQEFATGSGNFVDGKIAGGSGNNNLVSGNDSYAVGNMNTVGRISFPVSSQGIEDAGDGLGNRYYVVVAASEGDIIAMFPNKLVPTDSIVPRYGVGAQMDTAGNIYASGYILYTNLAWAAHNKCYIKTGSESYDTLMRVMKTSYNAVTGTKIYLQTSTKLWNKDITYIFSSYSPVVIFRRFNAGGNGMFAAGKISEAWGVGSVALGYGSKAIYLESTAIGLYAKSTNQGANAIGYSALASGLNSTSIGYESVASGQGSGAFGRKDSAKGLYSMSLGYLSKSNGAYSNSFGYYTTASGDYSFALGSSTTASGANSTAIGLSTSASGAAATSLGYYTNSSGIASTAIGGYTQATANYSTSLGLQSKATIAGEIAYSSGKITNVGDCQVHEYTFGVSKTGVGWHEIIFFNITDSTSLYSFEIFANLIDVTVDSASYKQSACYKFEGAFNTIGTSQWNYNAIGTPTRTLLGENFTVGDGLTTGPRLSWYGNNAGTNRVDLRLDGLAAKTFKVAVSIKLTQFKL